MSEFKAKMHKIRFPPGLRPAPRLRTALPRPVAAIQVVQVVRCTRAHDPWGPTSEDKIAIFFEKLLSFVSHVASHSGYCREIVF